ncbi:MAG: hypothetical protein V7604_3065 [Hyphomicrobiales bacterium]
MENARVGERPRRYGVEIGRYQFLLGQMGEPAPRQPNRFKVQISVIAAFLAAMAAAGAARAQEIRRALRCAGPVRSVDGGKRSVGHHGFKVGGQCLAPGGFDQRQWAITARQLNIAPSNHVANPAILRCRTVVGLGPEYRNVEAGGRQQRRAQKSERPRGEPRPLDGGGGAGSPPQPCGERRAAETARRIGYML